MVLHLKRRCGKDILFNRKFFCKARTLRIICWLGRDFLVVDTNTYRKLIGTGPIRGQYCNPIDQSEAVTLIWPDIRDIVARSQTSSTSGHTGEAELIIEEKQISTPVTIAFDFIEEQDI